MTTFELNIGLSEDHGLERPYELTVTPWPPGEETSTTAFWQFVTEEERADALARLQEITT